MACIDNHCSCYCMTALSNLDGTYYLNGRWTISPAMDLDAAGTTWKYSRGKDHRETLMADGPTTEPLMLVVSTGAQGGIRCHGDLSFYNLCQSSNIRKTGRNCMDWS